jgi:hypothetical protein
VPETDGPTCTSCLTLNPVGAPACIRCNLPLPAWAPAAGPAAVGGAPAAGPADWPGGPASGPSDRRGGAGIGTAAAQPVSGGSPTDWPGAPTPRAGEPPPGPGGSPATAAVQYPPPTPAPKGLAVPPRGAPGGSRSAAAAVQPPGYGLGADLEPADPVNLSPVQQRRISRRIAIVGGIVVLLVLGLGGGALWLTRPRYLDTDAVAGRIGAELTQRLHETVTVRCPGSPRQRGGETFRCTASNGRGITQPVRVTVLDTAGRYEWTLG